MTVESLEYGRGQILRYLLRRNPAPDVRGELEKALCRLDDLVAEAEKPCDAAWFWGDQARQSGCTRLTTRPLYSSHLLDRYDGPQLPFEIQAQVFNDGIYGPTRFAWRGPVVVLIDEDSASAAELFAGNLQHLAGSVLVGLPTAATGSGWSLGRRAWILPRSKMQLYMPDTVQYWPDGENAREGLVPDVPTRWSRNQDPVKMAKELLEALRAVDFPDASFTTSRELPDDDPERSPEAGPENHSMNLRLRLCPSGDRHGYRRSNPPHLLPPSSSHPVATSPVTPSPRPPVRLPASRAELFSGSEKRLCGFCPPPDTVGCGGISDERSVDGPINRFPGIRFLISPNSLKEKGARESTRASRP